MMLGQDQKANVLGRTFAGNIQIMQSGTYEHDHLWFLADIDRLRKLKKNTWGSQSFAGANIFEFGDLVYFLFAYQQIDKQKI